MRKILVGSLLVASLGIAALGVAAVDPVGAVTAQVSGKPHAHPGPLEQALNDLVGKGTISQDQADAVTAGVQEKRKEGWAKRPRLGKALVTDVATQLGMDPKDLVAELRSGKSIADVAGEKSVDPQTIIDHLVATIDGKIDQRVSDKKLDQAKADVMKQNLPGRVADFVNKVRGKGSHAQPNAEAPSTTDTSPPSTDAPTTTAPDSTTSSSADSTTSPGSTPSGTGGN